MKNLFGLLPLVISFIILSSCSENVVKHPVIGDWQLTTWTIGIPFDLNNNAVFSENLLEETTCEVKEILSFDKHGIVTSKNSFNPQITVSLKDGSDATYYAYELCAEGTIGFSTDYEPTDDYTVKVNLAKGTLDDKKLTLVYKDAIRVYNENLTEIIETRNLTLIYQKQ